MDKITRRGLLAAAVAVVAASSVTLAGCSSAAPNDSSGPVTLNVWLMKDSAPDALIVALNKEFEAAHPNVTVKAQILEWDGRDVKWKTALASDNPPDVMEMGNTDVLAYSASGGLADLTSRDFENKATWLKGLAEAGSYDGKLYGVPYYGGDRVVIYRKDLWKAAGLSAEPTTLADLKAAGAALMAKGGKDFSGLYFPGRYQYAALSFVYDAGGTIATKNGNAWTAGLSSAQSQAGLTAWADFVKAVSRAPADVDETNLQDVIGQEHTAMIIGQAWMVGVIKNKYPKIADQLAAFPMPGTQGTMPVFLGGSNLVSAAGSKHADLAYEWIKLMTGTKYQTQLGQAGLMPNTTSLESAVSGITQIQLKAAARSWFTPTSTQWSNVDNAKVLMDMLQAIASGDKTVAAATADADKKINDMLNATG